MEREHTAAWISALSWAVTAVLTAVPYVLALPATVATYYRVTAVGPPLAALFAVVAAVAVLAGATGRTDPATAAGASVVLGLFVAGVSVWWALAVRPETVASVSAADAFQHHRWLLALAAVVGAGAAGWFARSVLASR